MDLFKNVFREIRKQLTDTPGFVEKPSSAALSGFSATCDKIDQQIEKAMEHKTRSMIFLIAPFGGGKTTQIQHFRKTHPQLHFVYKSFVKVNSLDFAFLHLTSYWARLGVILLALLFCYAMVDYIPTSGALPFLLAIGYLFAKNAANLIYTFQETIDTLFTRREKVIVIEDLERSAISPSEQWALLANLWEYKRTYLISLGYSADEKKEKLKMLEYAIKLEGSVIEIPCSGEINEKIVETFKPDFPFRFSEQRENSAVEWLSLFTPRELQMIREQVFLRSGHGAELDSQLTYVEICLDLLSKKIGLEKEEIVFYHSSRQIKGAVPDPDKLQYIHSFVESIVPTLNVKLEIQNPTPV